MKALVSGGVIAAVAGMLMGAGMKAPIPNDLPHPELQQISFPVERLPQEPYAPSYVIAAGYVPAGAWSSEDARLWQASYVAPASAEHDLALDSGEEFDLGAEPTAPQGDEAAATTPHDGDPTAPYAAGMTSETAPAIVPAEEEVPAARPTSSWPNKRTDSKQQVFNGQEGFERLALEAAA
jgi:hypothetical protein